MKKSILSLFGLLFALNLLAQAPTNDQVANAIELTLGAAVNENVLTGTLVDATDSVDETTPQIPAPGCASYQGNDIWYKLTVGVTPNIIISAGGRDTGLAVYSGNPNALELIDCDDDSNIASFNSNIVLTSRTQGEELFVRVWAFGNNNLGEIQVSAYAQNTPDNDTFANAIPLTLGTDFDENKVTGSNLGASDSTNELTNPIPTPGCGDSFINYTGGDIWYKTTVGPSGNIIIEEGTSTQIDPYLTVYSGTPDTLVAEGCGRRIELRGRTEGEVLFIRVWEDDNDRFGTFEVSAYSFTLPDNDTFANAITLTIGTDFEENKIIGTNVGASDSTDELTNPIPTPDCESSSINYNGGDIWYKTTVGDSGNIIIQQSGVSIAPYLTIYSGTPEALVAEGCGRRIELRGRTEGEEIFIRVWEDDNDNFGTFEVSAYSFTLPDNDTFANAITLTVGTNFEENKVTGTNLGASDSTNELTNPIPTPDCGDSFINYNGGDIWYKTMVGATRNIIIEEGTSTQINPYLTVYSGTPDALVAEGCGRRIELRDRTEGEEIFIRVWEDGNDNFGTFEVSAYSFTVPDNDAFANAITLTLGTNFDENKVTGTNLGASDSTDELTNPIPTPDCESSSINYNGGDIWYKTTVGDSGNIIIQQSGVSIAPYLTIYSGTPEALVDEGCGRRIELRGRTEGEEIFIRVWEDDNNSFGTFEISAYDFQIVPNDIIQNAIAIGIGIDFDDQDITSNNLGTTDSVNETTIAIPAPECASYQGNDVWFKVNVANNADLTFETGLNLDTGLAIYSGGIDNLTLVNCNDDFSGTSSQIIIPSSELTLNEELFIRVWGYNGEEDIFNISVYDGIGGPTLSTNSLSTEEFSYYINNQQQLVINSKDQLNTIEIYNTVGQKELVLSSVDNTYDVSSLSTGIYFVTTAVKGKPVSFKIVK